jgi:multiple sugar transport system substrate-binding protein
LRRTVSILAALAGAGLLAACGSSGKGPATLSWYVFPEPSGSFIKAAADCTQSSHGAYRIAIQNLPTTSDGQRTQLVRRLAAGDSSIDIVAMDVDWTAEFAGAKWVLPWTGALAQQVSRGVLAGPLRTATWNGRLYAAPLNSNTQLLWYRKDLVPTPPTTWSQMIADARRLAAQGKPHLIEEQGAQYEGLTVWFNSLVNSAGGQILTPNGQMAVGPSSETAAAIMHKLATSPAADPSLNNSQEDQARLAFESGAAAFEINYPYVWAAAQTDVPKIAKVMGYAAFPGVTPGRPAKVTIGGYNLGVSSHSPHPQQAFQAVACLVGAANQQRDAIKGGLAPVLASLYDSPALAQTYPFHALIKTQLENYGIRPQTPAYSDVTLAIQKKLSPPASINPPSVVSSLRGEIKAALGSGALL